jgi:putative transposase
MSIEKDHPRLSVRRQCRLLLLSRSTLYYTPVGESTDNLALMRVIDEQFLQTPWYGSRQMARRLRRQGRKTGCRPGDDPKCELRIFGRDGCRYPNPDKI